MNDLDKARKLWGEELLLEREQSLQIARTKIAELECEIRDLREYAKSIAEQNNLFKKQFPRTAYVPEIAELKMTIDALNAVIDGREELQLFRIETNRDLIQELDNAEDYISELYRLNPGLNLPNGKKYEPDPDS